MIISDKTAVLATPGRISVGAGLLVMAGRRMAWAAPPQNGAAGVAHAGAMGSLSAGDWILMVVLALFVGLVTLMTLNRKYGDKAKHRQADKEKPATPEAFVRAVMRRAPAVLEMIDSGDYEEPPPVVRMVVEALQYRAGALRLEDPDGRVTFFSPGPEIGIDAEGKWLFSVDDSIDVLDCQVVFRFEGDRVFLFAGQPPGDQATVKAEPVAVQSLEAGDRVALNEAAYFSVERRLENGGVALEIETGPEAGQRLVLADRDFAPAAVDCELTAGLPEPGFSFSRGRCLLTIGRVDAKHRLELENPAFPYKLRPYSGQVMVLCPGDRLLDAAGRCCYRVGLVPAGRYS